MLSTKWIINLFIGMQTFFPMKVKNIYIVILANSGLKSGHLYKKLKYIHAIVVNWRSGAIGKNIGIHTR